MDRYRMLPSYRYYDVEGTSPLTLDRSVGKSLRDYKIYGNSVQDGTPSPDNPIEIQSCGDKSKNLFNEELLLTNKSVKKTEEGYAFTIYPVPYYEDTLQDMSGTELVKHIKSVLKPNVTYTLSRKVRNYTIGSVGTVAFIGRTLGSVFWGSEGAGLRANTFSLTQEQIDDIYHIYIYGNSGEPILFEYIQLEEGETATEYEPYGYKIPIEVGGKNLVDMSKVSRGYLNQSGEVLNSGGLQTSDFIDVSNTSNISISSAKSYAFYDEEKVFISGETKSMTIFRNYTIPENAKYIRFDWQTENVNGDIVYAIAGSYTEDTFPSYEPYKEPIKTNIYLDEPLKNGEYIDFINQRLVKSDTEQPIDLPPILTHKGTNVVSVGTEIQPSNMQIKYYK